MTLLELLFLLYPFAILIVWATLGWVPALILVAASLLLVLLLFLYDWIFHGWAHTPPCPQGCARKTYSCCSYGSQCDFCGSEVRQDLDHAFTLDEDAEERLYLEWVPFRGWRRRPNLPMARIAKTGQKHPWQDDVMKQRNNEENDRTEVALVSRPHKR